jgi:peptide deformylase
MILPIYTYGQPVLRQVTQDITPEYPELKKLIEDMFETLRKSEGVGLAAPQVGLNIRLVVIDLDCISEDSPEFKGFFKTFINGEILEYDESKIEGYNEGCLSLPGIYETVKRPTRVRIHYFDENWVEHDEWVDGFPARVVQHEFDHLEGEIFIDHITALRKQMIKGKLSNLLKGKVHCNYKVQRLTKK